MNKDDCYSQMFTSKSTESAKFSVRAVKRQRLQRLEPST